MTCVSQLEAHRKACGDTEGFQSARITVLKLLAPFAPFITEELWARLGLRDIAGSIHRAPWPVWDPAAIRNRQVEMAVLIDNRVRDHITVAAEASEAEVRQTALNTSAANAALSAGTVRRVIVVPGRLVNIVTR
jgi:leucyl-tRNA synthetase